MRYSIILLIPVLLLRATQVFGQAEEPDPFDYPEGITIRYGLSSFAMRDRYISPERYAGALPYYSLGWVRTHRSHVYTLDFHFQYSHEVENNHVKSDVLVFNLNQGFIYPLKPVHLFRRELALWMGPAVDVEYFENNPLIAVSGFDYTNSYLTMISLGFRGDGVYPLAGKISLKSSLRGNLLTLGQRTVDSEEDNQPRTRLLYPVNGLHVVFELGTGYDLLNWLTMAVSYRFELIRATAWDEVLTAANGAFMELQVHF
jgi:hypothetical protein